MQTERDGLTCMERVTAVSSDWFTEQLHSLPLLCWDAEKKATDPRDGGMKKGRRGC